MATGDSVLVRLNKEGVDKVAWTEAERNNLLAFEKSVGHTPEL